MKTILKWILGVSVCICLILLLCFIESPFKAAAYKWELTVLDRPNYMKIEKEDDLYVLQPDTEEYELLFNEIELCWKRSLGLKGDAKGKVEFILTPPKEMPSDTMKITFFYDNPKEWTPYALESEDGEGMVIGKTYMFFPLAKNEFSSMVLVSESEEDLEKCFSIRFCKSLKLTEILRQY